MTKIQAARQDWADGVAILIRQDGPDGRRLVCVSMEMKEVAPGAYIAPTATLTTTAAQQLMDDLWNCGLRPTEGSGSAGSLAATQAHLKDMQKIAFGLLEKDGIK